MLGGAPTVSGEYPVDFPRRDREPAVDRRREDDDAADSMHAPKTVRSPQISNIRSTYGAPHAANSNLTDHEPPSGRFLDDDLRFELQPASDLELSGPPATHRAPVVPLVPRKQTRAIAPPAPPPNAAAAVSGAADPLNVIHRSAALVPTDPTAAIVAFAGYGDPPSSFWATPEYAFRVRVRRRELRRDLASAIGRRSPDVSLYQAAIDVADRSAERTGWILTAAIGALAAVAVFALYTVVLPLLG